MRFNYLKATPENSRTRGSCSPPRSGRGVRPAAVNLTAGPTTATLPDGSAGADVGLQLRHGRGGSTGHLRGAESAPAAGWSPVVITVPTGQDLHDQPHQQPVVRAADNMPTSLVIVGQLGGGLGDAPATTTPSPDHTRRRSPPGRSRATTGTTDYAAAAGASRAVVRTEVAAGATDRR